MWQPLDAMHAGALREVDVVQANGWCAPQRALYAWR